VSFFVVTLIFLAYLVADIVTWRRQHRLNQRQATV
jgi:hypothetical protein